MIKKYYRKIYRTWLGKKLSSEEFLHILTSLLDLKKGDSVLVHASFGNLKPDFSPEKAVEILMNVVGKEGNLLMPYYPYDSKKFLESGEVFDVNSTPTRSGILSATFSSFPEVKKSLHPIKSLAVWGKDRDELISRHHYSKLPFDQNSPYYRLLRMQSAKTIGLGVFKNSMLHMYEDNITAYPTYYEGKKYIAKCINYEGKVCNVETYTHGKSNRVESCEYLKLIKCPSYKEVLFKQRRFYVLNEQIAYKHIARLVESENKTAEYFKQDTSFVHYIKSKIPRI